MVLKKTLSPQEALEYIAYAVLVRDLPEDFDGNITCEYSDDGTVDITADDRAVETKTKAKKKEKKTLLN